MDWFASQNTYISHSRDFKTLKVPKIGSSQKKKNPNTYEHNDTIEEQKLESVPEDDALSYAPTEIFDFGLNN